MPTRILRDGILESERVDALSHGAEVFYRRLMSRVDDYGRFTANPMILRSSLYPLKVDQITVADIEQWLAECAEGDRPLVIVYEVDRKRYLELQDFNQRTRTASKYPSPSGAVDSTVKQGRIYFLQGQDSKRIKIGYTEWDPINRLATFQTGSPEKLTLLGSKPGSMKDERTIHRKFVADCVGGEWFNPSDELMDFIESECAQNTATAFNIPPTRARGRTKSESESETKSETHSSATPDGADAAVCVAEEMPPPPKALARSTSPAFRQYIGAYLAAGVALSDEDVYLAAKGTKQTPGFYSYGRAEQQVIADFFYEKAKRTQARFMGLPINGLAKCEWKRKGGTRVLPLAREPSKSEQATRDAAEMFLEGKYGAERERQSDH